MARAPTLSNEGDADAHSLSRVAVSAECALDAWRVTGGLYIIEDIFVTPTPWAGWNTSDNIIPNRNRDCGRECYFIQRPSDHPFLSQQPPALRRALRGRDWFFSITGLHRKTGGLDMLMVIRK